MKRANEYTINPRRSKRKCIKEGILNNYPYILTIIDMQPRFYAATNKETINAVKNLIINAKKDGAYVIFAQYMKQGKSNHELIKLVNTYYDKSFVVARKNDKSDAIITKIYNNGIRSNDMKICGVNTDACVYSSVIGLSNKLPNWNIHLIKNACNSVTHDKKYINNRIKKMAELPNVICK